MTIAASPSLVLGRIAKLHRALEKAGLTYDDMQFVIDNPRVSGHIITLVQDAHRLTAQMHEPLSISSDLETVMETEFFKVLCNLGTQHPRKFNEGEAADFLIE